MKKYSTKEIMDRIRGMAPIIKQLVPLVKKEPVLVIEKDETKRYWAILDNKELTTPDGKASAEEVIDNGGTILVIWGPISTEEVTGCILWRF